MGEDPYSIKTGYGRPKTLGKVRSTVIYLYEKYKDVYPKAVELAKTEGISFSELVSRALKEYVEAHYPGNPQIPLKTFTAETPLAKTLEAKFTAEDLKATLERLENTNPSELPYYTNISMLKQQVLKLARLNKYVRKKEYRDLIEQAMKLLEER